MEGDGNPDHAPVPVPTWHGDLPPSFDLMAWEASISARLQNTVSEVWGANFQWRLGQREACEAALHGRDLIIQQPTGSGKTIVAVVPAACAGSGKWTLMIVPTIAIADQHVRNLRELGVPVVRVGEHPSQGTSPSSPTAPDRNVGGVLVVLPAAMVTTAVQTAPGVEPPTVVEGVDPQLSAVQLNQYARNIVRVVFDEVHAVIEWGDTFYTTYRSAVEWVKKRRPGLPLTLLSATAPPAMLADVCERLGHFPLLRRTYVDRTSPSRPLVNMQFVCEEPSIPNVVSAIEAHVSGTGKVIVFCRSKDSVIEVADRLGGHYGTQHVTTYYGGLHPRTRARRMRYNDADGPRIMVANAAFTMGVDQPGIELVVVYDGVESIGALMQRAGRGGRRPGMTSTCVAFWSHEQQRHWENLVVGSVPDLQHWRDALETAPALMLCQQVRLLMMDTSKCVHELVADAFQCDHTNVEGCLCAFCAVKDTSVVTFGNEDFVCEVIDYIRAAGLAEAAGRVSVDAGDDEDTDDEIGDDRARHAEEPVTTPTCGSGVPRADLRDWIVRKLDGHPIGGHDKKDFAQRVVSSLIVDRRVCLLGSVTKGKTHRGCTTRIHVASDTPTVSLPRGSFSVVCADLSTSGIPASGPPAPSIESNPVDMPSTVELSCKMDIMPVAVRAVHDQRKIDVPGSDWFVVSDREVCEGVRRALLRSAMVGSPEAWKGMECAINDVVRVEEAKSLAEAKALAEEKAEAKKAAEEANVGSSDDDFEL
jgi:superfamily II DNA helicase RecQ